MNQEITAHEESATEEESTTATYRIPRKLLTWHSSYFAAALDPTISVGSADHPLNQLHLEEDAKVFEAFRCWLYTRSLKDMPNATKDLTPRDLYLSVAVLCKIWVFADIRGIPALGNAAIDMLHERVCSRWNNYSQDTLKYTYRNTTPGSNLRKYFVNAFTKLRGYKKFMEHMTEESVTTEFLLDAMPILVRQGEKSAAIDRGSWTGLDRCQWHDHSGPGGKLRLELRKSSVQRSEC
jgi:hypothetical protein